MEKQTVSQQLKSALIEIEALKKLNDRLTRQLEEHHQARLSEGELKSKISELENKLFNKDATIKFRIERQNALDEELTKALYKLKQFKPVRFAFGPGFYRLDPK